MPPTPAVNLRPKRHRRTRAQILAALAPNALELRAIRAALEWRPQAMADAIGISHQGYARYECGERKVREMVIRLARSIAADNGLVRQESENLAQESENTPCNP